MHIRRLVLCNFQSHQKTTIQLAPDFNCIRGSSRVGKTSIIRALSFLLFDDWSETYIRKGASSTSVFAEFDTGLQMEREKGPDVNKITVTTPDGNKQLYDRFGTTLPFEVRKLLGIFPAKIDTDYDVNLNLADQDDSAFMLSVSSGLKTKFINRLTGAHIIDSSLRILNKEKLELSEETGRISQNITKVKASLEQFNKLDSISKNVDILELKFKDVETHICEFDMLHRIKQRMTEIDTRYTAIVHVLDQFVKIIPKIEQYNKDKGDFDKLVSIRTKLRDTARVLAYDTGVLEDTRYLQDQLMGHFKDCPLCGSELEPGKKLRWLK